MLRRILVLLAALAMVVGLLADVAAADPSHNVLPNIALTCSDGQSLTVLPGTATNSSSIAFVRDSTSIFVARTFVVTLNGVPVYGFERGLNGFAEKDLVTCTGPWTVDGVTAQVTVTGFLTPARL
jgi:hypothetical protein